MEILMRLCIRGVSRLLVMFTVLSALSSVYAQDEGGIQSRLTFGIGPEWLSYEERVAESDIRSKATVQNTVLGFEGVKRWKPVYIGVRGVIPLLRGHDQEEWTVSGTLFQTDRIEYGWIRISGYVGLPAFSFFNPSIGLRYSSGRQERSEIVAWGIPYSSATETVEALHGALGLQGKYRFRQKWQLGYSIEGLLPLHVDVANSVIPGWGVSGVGGYGMEARGEVAYELTPRVSLTFTLYGGRTHWNGSEWKPFSGGFARWPENNTDYGGGLFGIAWAFL